MTDDTASAKSVADVRCTLSRIAVEIVVGFEGVYAAFALTAYHERQGLSPTGAISSSPH